MRPTRSLGLALLAVAATGLATIGVTSSGATDPTFTWRQRPVAEDSNFTEPSVSVRESDGHIVVCAPGGGNAYWVSDDDGATFERYSTEGFGGDCEIEFLQDGTLVSSDLAVTTSVIHRSEDGGRTWEQTDDAGPEQDRQWFAEGPDGTLYHVYHSITHEYEFFVKSTDGGKTWSTPYPINSPDQLTGPPAVIAQPGDSPSPLDQGYNTFSGPMAVDQNTGDIYVAWSISDAQSNVQSGHGFGPTRGIVVGHSPGGGNIGTWTNRYAVVGSSLTPGEGDINGAIFPWLTLDQAGNVYVFFNSNREGAYHTYYVVSTDKTVSWKGPFKVDGNPTGEGATVFAVGHGGAPGVVDIAWMESDGGAGPDDGESSWHVDFAQVRDAASDAPKITRSRVSDHVVHFGSICQQGILCSIEGDRSLGDFFELAIGPDGMAQIVWADNGAQDEPQKVWWAKQQSGPSAYAATVEPGPGPAPDPDPAPAPRPNPPAPAPAPPKLPATGTPDGLALAALLALGVAGGALALRRRAG